MATEADRTTATELVNKQIGSAPPAMLGQQAMLLGLTEEEFKQELIDQNTASQVVNREFKPKVVITEEMSKAFYDENQAQFEAPEQVKAAHILLATKLPDGTNLSEDDKKAKRAEAEALLVRAKAGEDFTALAKEYSEDPGVKENDGFYTFGKGEMVPEFEAAAWKLDDGGISEIVVTDFGFHIIKKYESLPAQILPFTEAEKNFRDYLSQLELQKILHDYTDELKKDPSIVFVDEKYKP
jgi:parvulin-like peptidyl-prolyl isomerase